ncbi:hypothetical protein AC249_AIPGENE17969 [Exaiptasia diaphana]|nr:hypothetical protein AC249_AIPGENE17969 [Exaiptasia diaphana]
MRPAVGGESIAGARNPDGWRLSLSSGGMTEKIETFKKIHMKKNQPINVKIQPPPPAVKEPTEPPQEAQQPPDQQEETVHEVGLEREILQALPKTSKTRSKMLLEIPERLCGCISE